MLEISPPQRASRSAAGAAIGIVVTDGGQATASPRAVAFVWGKRLRAAPSLPYGRWKKEVRPAA